MTTAFHDFLTWFDGWSENIETVPTERQWGRLKEKLAEVRAAGPAPAAAAVIVAERNGVQTAPGLPPVDEGGPIRPRKEKTATPVPVRATWLAKFKGHLMDQYGYDPESAQEMVPPMGQIDPASDPVAAANAAHRRLEN